MSEYPFSSDAEFDAIADAVQSTERGRSFLVEFTRRRRADERAALRNAMGQLEFAIAREMAHFADMPEADVAPAAMSAAHLATRVTHAVEALDGIVASTTSAVAESMKAARQARALAERARSSDERLAADLADLAATIESCGLHAQAETRAREIFEVLSEVRAHLDRRSEMRTVINPASVVKSPPFLRVVADNDAKPVDRVSNLRNLSEAERIALFT